MVRTKLFIAALLLGALCTQGAWAAVAGEKAAGAGTARLPDARILGITESALAYCRRLEPSATLKLDLQRRKLIRDVSATALEEIRKSDEYRQAYTAESDFVAKVDEHNSKRICAQPLAKGR